MTYHIVTSDEGDWIALYKDGKLLHQGHSIQEQELLRLLGIEFTEEELDLSDWGYCPSTVEELKEVRCSS